MFIAVLNVVLAYIHLSKSFLAHTGLLGIVYAIDTTSSDSDLKEIGRLIKNSIEPYNFANGGATRVGLVAYGISQRTMVKFPGIDKAGFSLAADLIGHTSGARDVIGALNFVKDSFFTPGQLRPNARKLIVSFVNGRKPLPNVAAIESSLKSLNDSGIGYVIVTIGMSQKDSADLRRIAANYGKVVQVARSADLPDSLRFIIEAGAQKEG